jgi:hypothetical protein
LVPAHRLSRSPGTSRPCERASEAEYERECVVDGAQLTGVEVPGRSPEALRVDDGRLLDQHSRSLAFEADRRAKARGPGTGRRRCDERRAEVQELVGLDDDCVPRAALLAPARSPG